MPPTRRFATLRAQTFTETLNLNLPVTVLVKGGYDTDFANTVDATVIKGGVNISNGNVTLENIVIQ